MQDEHEITELLRALGAGDAEALDELFTSVYEELRWRAHAQRRRWQGDATLNTTALIHEAYLKLAGADPARWADRGHFFAVAATAMRQILIDHARLAQANKRGGGKDAKSLSTSALPPVSPAARDELLALDEALRRLQALDARQARVVECRFFAGFDVEETAAAVGVSVATVKRDWRAARLWLYRELTGGTPAG